LDQQAAVDGVHQSSEPTAPQQPGSVHLVDVACKQGWWDKAVKAAAPAAAAQVQLHSSSDPVIHLLMNTIKPLADPIWDDLQAQ
jgi:hypothetical protein